ncbi:hypothetical protein ACIRL2_10645, partial [Embleya sp. NPDC127516]|uniref:hypothetical protein n=1 Tax=Embleya sp. NPDC127516 TaxID=3363990 RepID=UPI0037F9D35B
TLLSSQGTDASFGAESTAPSGRLTFKVFQFFVFRVSLSRFQLSTPFRRLRFPRFRLPPRFRVFRLPDSSRSSDPLFIRCFVLSAFETLVSSASGPLSLADPFSRLPRPRLITLAMSAADEPRVVLRISPALDASTLAGFPGKAESHSENAIPSNKWQHK